MCPGTRILGNVSSALLSKPAYKSGVDMLHFLLVGVGAPDKNWYTKAEPPEVVLLTIVGIASAVNCRDIVVAKMLLYWRMALLNGVEAAATVEILKRFLPKRSRRLFLWYLDLKGLAVGAYRGAK
jgi:hypothetical protein